ncbi:MAG: NnrS family protein [Candidatus Latescibacterota bacterium]|nr:NnrS family protein [Candidatus Latescibacterota bacterium]
MAYLLLSTFFIEAGLRQLGALHLSFVGGFVLMTFIIASRVVIGHAGFEPLWQGHRPSLMIPLALIALSTPVRLATDAFPDNYAEWRGAVEDSGCLAWPSGVSSSCRRCCRITSRQTDGPDATD